LGAFEIMLNLNLVWWLSLHSLLSLLHRYCATTFTVARADYPDIGMAYAIPTFSVGFQYFLLPHIGVPPP